VIIAVLGARQHGDCTSLETASGCSVQSLGILVSTELLSTSVHKCTVLGNYIQGPNIGMGTRLTSREWIGPTSCDTDR